MVLKLKQKHTESSEELATIQLIDKIGDYQVAAAKVKDKIAKLQLELEPLEKATAELEVIANDLYAESGDDDEFYMQGTRYRVKVGKKAKKREITDIKYVFSRMKAAFWTVASIKLGDADRYLTPAEQEKCIKVERTDRKVSVEPKNPET